MLNMSMKSLMYSKELKITYLPKYCNVILDAFRHLYLFKNFNIVICIACLMMALNPLKT